MKKIKFLKVGATGILNITEYVERRGEEKQIVRSGGSPFKVMRIRSRDFIIETKLKNGEMYCKLPENKRDGSENWKEIDNGFERAYKSVYSDGTIYEFTTVYIFDTNGINN